jgi:hypothetical protein
VIPPRRIIWGSWRVAQVQILCMKRAMELSRGWRYCINLSGQDYPLRTQVELAEILENGPRDRSFLEVLKFAEASENPKKRLEYWWVPWRGRMRKLWRRKWPGFEVFWGSNQWVLTREACEFVAQSALSRRMQRCFRFTLCADELIFQNILMHSPLREKIVPEPMRKVVWEGGSHPKIMSMADRDELLAGDAWFARKFDAEVDSAIMDALDEELQKRAAGINAAGKRP